MRLLVIVFVALTFILSFPLQADITLVADTVVDGLGGGEGETVTKISGMKGRTEANLGRHATITLMDLDAKEMILLNTRKERAEVYDMSPIAAQQVELQTHDVSLEPNGNKRQAAGYTCEDHDLMARIEAGMEGMELQVVMSGVVCLSKEAPGQEEAAAFYQAMAERGLFFGNPDAAKSQPGRERGMTELYRKMSENGLALISNIHIGFEGSGPMAAMLGRMKVQSSTTVKSISTDAIPASEFVPPSDYKIKKKK